MKSRLIRNLQLGEICANIGYEQCRAANVRNTVQDVTWDSYAAEARPMVIAHEAMNPGFGLEEGEARMEQMKGDIGADFAMYYIAHNIERHFFSQFLYSRSIRGIKCCKARCALLKAQEVFGKERWAGEEDTIMETDGADSRAAKLGSLEPPIGSITEDMLPQLLAAVSHRRADEMRLAMTVQFGAAIRYSELINLRVRDVKEEGIYLAHTKTMKARYAYKLPTPFKKINHWPCGQLALKVLQSLVVGKPPEAILFPEISFKLPEYNAQIKAASKACGWPTSVRFRGSHSLRHGGVGAAKESLKTDSKPEEIAKKLLMSEEMVDHYGATNLEKHERYLRKVQKQIEWTDSHQKSISPTVWRLGKRSREEPLAGFSSMGFTPLEESRRGNGHPMERFFLPEIRHRKTTEHPMSRFFLPEESCPATMEHPMARFFLAES